MFDFDRKKYPRTHMPFAVHDGGRLREFKKEESRLLPADIDYNAIAGLRLEARQKLSRIRPMSIGQAGRISGVSPADIAVLLIYLEQSSAGRTAEA